MKNLIQKALCSLLIPIACFSSGAQEYKSTISINDSIDFSLIKSGKTLQLIIDFKENDDTEYRWIEAYIKRSDGFYRLHVSGQLGQQTYNGSNWNEEWKWGNNKDWEATTFGLNNSQNKEYLITLHEEWITDSLTMMLTLFLADKNKDFSEKPVVINFPISGSNTNTQTWKTYTIKKN
jgi:hypothetical protein